MSIARTLQRLSCAAIVAALAPLPLAARPPTAPRAIDMPAALLLEWQADFVIIAVQADLIERAASTLAIQRARHPGLRAYATDMIAERDGHWRFAQSAVALNLPVPSELGRRELARLLLLEQTTDGPAFDAAYVALLSRVHRESMAAHLAYAASPSHPGLAQASREARTRLHYDATRLQAATLASPQSRPFSLWPEDASD